MTSPSPAYLRELICTLAPQWFSYQILDLHYLPGGYSNHNYRFQVDGAQYVIRVPGGIAQPAAHEREAHLYRHLKTRSDAAGVPSLIALDTDSGAMISRWQEGPLLVDAPAEPHRVIDYLRSLHEQLPASDHRYDPLEVSRSFLSNGAPDPDIVDAVASMRWQPADLRSCHNDLNPWNVIRCSTTPWVTLDWEWFGSNDPLFDLVTLHQGLGWDIDTLADLATDLLGHPASEERLLINLRVFWLREYAWAHAALANGSQRTEIIEQKREAGAAFRRLSV
jgi:thiamine kinase-like enzyme